MKFTLEIELGNDAVQDGDDINYLLEVNRDEFALINGEGTDGPKSIRDFNGNTVGSWGVFK